MQNHSSLGVSEDLIFSQFFTAMYTCRIRPRENFTPILDGQTHRFAVEGDRGSAKSGAYYIHNDDRGIIFGVMDFHVHSEMQTYPFDYSAVDPDTRLEYLKQNNISTASGFSGVRTISQTQRVEIERRNQEKANAEKEKQQRALSMALSEYRVAEPFAHETYTFSHPYFLKKFVDTGIYLDILRCKIIRDFRLARVLSPFEGGICKQGEILVPMRNIITGDLQSLIHIPVVPDKERGFMKYIYTGTSITGAAHWLITEKSRNADTLFVAEGISTSLALIADLQGRYPVFSAGSCGNLYSVCKALRTKYPEKVIVITADNDANHAGENAAKKCVEAGWTDTYEMPTVTGWDWYDDYLSRKKKGA